MRNELEIALQAARAGANVLLKAGLPRPGGRAQLKGIGDYVTEADRNSEKAIVDLLIREAPEIPVLAEEAGGNRGPRMWAVDPLDGTTNFMRGLPVVGVSVALVEDNRPSIGVVLAPFLGLEFTAASGRGARLNGERLPTLRSLDPGHAVVGTGFPFRNPMNKSLYRAFFQIALDRFEDLRRPGAASLDLAWTAAGTFDGFFELGLSTWDVAAGAALVMEVGGLVSDWNGNQNWLESGDILAGSPSIHQVLLEMARMLSRT
jgi:myo-inositol-1(or 4)-monophosphatase